MQSDILRFTENPLTDEGIERYEWHEYEPVARTNLNTAGEIRINIELQDLFSHPSESYLLFEGRLTKADGTFYANADAAAISQQRAHASLQSDVLFPIESRNRKRVSSRTSDDYARPIEISQRLRSRART